MKISLVVTWVFTCGEALTLKKVKEFVYNYHGTKTKRPFYYRVKTLGLK